MKKNHMQYLAELSVWAWVGTAAVRRKLQLELLARVIGEPEDPASGYDVVQGGHSVGNVG